MSGDMAYHYIHFSLLQKSSIELSVTAPKGRPTKLTII
jgi:hypothetical protein